MIVTKTIQPQEDTQEWMMEPTSLGERLFWARRNHAKLTQMQMRDRMQSEYGVDIGRNYISQIETEEGVKPSFEVVRAMAGVLKVSLDYLAGFTNSITPSSVPDDLPTYFSPEADEMAQLVDSMHPSQREVLLSVAKNMIVAPKPRQLERAEYRDLLDSVERDIGRPMRIKLEKIMRDSGLPVDANT
jgi:transcriptional regulator with XRE-family HTH domain